MKFDGKCDLSHRYAEPAHTGCPVDPAGVAVRFFIYQTGGQSLLQLATYSLLNQLSMATSSGTNTSETSIPKGLELEYNALRSEIVQRIGLRQNLVSITLTLSGLFLGISLAKDSVGAIALVYPPLATMLAFGWLQNDLRISAIGKYIREHLEEKIPGLFWETYCGQTRKEFKSNDWRFTVVSHGGIFLFTQLLAIGVGLFKCDYTPLELLLLIVACVAVIILVSIVFTKTLR